MTTRAFVTGATGFVGPYLCAHLEHCGDTVGKADEKLDVTDRDAVFATLARAKPDVVYHLAARSHVAASWQDPVATLRVNVEGTLNVLDAARAADVRRVLVVGSAEEYGRVDPADLPLREDAPLRPVSPYGASKVAASVLATQAWLGTGLETVRVRAFNHTGPGQTDDFFIPALARRIAEAERDGHDTISVGARDPVRDFNDVRDVVRAYHMVVERGVPGDVYNICTGRGASIGEVVDTMVAMASRPLEVTTDPALLRPADVPVLIGDATRLRDATGWAPEHELADTLAAVLEHARSCAAQGS
jgi:GDP-4-dehydro-6-deoxy-D-mannose reductase